MNVFVEPIQLKHYRDLMIFPSMLLVEFMQVIFYVPVLYILLLRIKCMLLGMVLVFLYIL